MDFPHNLDFSKKLVIETELLDWEPSPISGVERKILEREAPEDGRATSLVRYKPGVTFSAHHHPDGEEIFVLSGEFRDENGIYPKGTYIYNAKDSHHSPFSETGCTLFVKLNHQTSTSTQSTVVFTGCTEWLPGSGDLKVMPLHEDLGRNTALVYWPKGARHVPHSHFGGEEILVLDGTFCDEFGKYPKGTWIRSPHLSKHNPFSETGCLIWVTVGHLNKKE